MRLIINGKPRSFDVHAQDAAVDVQSLLRSLDVNPRLVAVAVNGDVIPKGEYGAAVVKEGDAVEVVRMVGGGQ